MPIFQTAFEIDATSEKVWNVPTAFTRYAEWNPQIPSISGALEPGAQISLRLALPGQSPMDFRAPSERFDPSRCLTWRGHLVAPWFFEGFRTFEISSVTDGQVRATHVEDVPGLFEPLFALVMGDAVRNRPAVLNDARRTRAESLT